MSSNTHQVTSLTLLKYRGTRQKWRGFTLMQRGHGLLRDLPGQHVYKLMGTGKGFGLRDGADLSSYAVLQVWDDEASAKSYFASDSFLRKLTKGTSQSCTIMMRCLRAHGEWKGVNPFAVHEDLDAENHLIAAITRASLRISTLRSFWSYAAVAQKPIHNATGLQFKLGIGEHPFLHMATFSIWNSLSDLNAYAYQTKEHLKAIKLTKEKSWYREELFARFQPYQMIGAWPGLDIDLPSLSD